MIRASFKPTDNQPDNINKNYKNLSDRAIYFQAIAVSLINPKAIIFLSAVFPQFITPSEAIIPQFINLFVTIILIVAIIHGGYAWFSFRLKGRPMQQSTKNGLSKLTGSVFISLGTLLY